MAIPDFQAMFAPFLKFLSDELEHPNTEIVEYLSTYFSLKPEELGDERLWPNRVSWVKTHLKTAGLIEVSKDVCKITNDGVEMLASNPSTIDLRYIQSARIRFVNRTNI